MRLYPYRQAMLLGTVFLGTGILTWGRTPFDASSVGLGIGLLLISIDMRHRWKHRAGGG